MGTSQRGSDVTEVKMYFTLIVVLVRLNGHYITLTTLEMGQEGVAKEALSLMLGSKGAGFYV